MTLICIFELHMKACYSPRIKTTKRVRFKPVTKNWIEVTTDLEGKILVNPYQLLYNNNVICRQWHRRR